MLFICRVVICPLLYDHKRSLHAEGFEHLLNLLCIFVANENDDWIDVNAVKPFDGMGCNVEQTVTVLGKKKTTQRATSVQSYINNKWLKNKETLLKLVSLTCQ